MRQLLIAISVMAPLSVVGADNSDCDGGSSYETNACHAQEWKKTEDKLNEVYQSIVNALKASKQTSTLSALRKEQRAWLKEREKICATQGEDYNDGWRSTVHASCIAEWSSDRTDELRGKFGKLTSEK